MHVGSMVLRVQPGALDTVHARLMVFEGVEVLEQREDGVALLLEAPTASQQRALHERIARLPGVAEASLIFQSSEI